MADNTDDNSEYPSPVEEAKEQAMRTVEFCRDQCKEQLQNKFDKALSKFPEAIHRQLKVAHRTIVQDIPHEMRQNMSDSGPKDYLNFTHRLGIDVFREFMAMVWDKLGKPISKEKHNLSGLVDDFVLFCKVKVKLGSWSPKERAQINIGDLGKYCYGRDWRSWRYSDDDYKKMVNKLLFRTDEDKSLVTTVRSNYLETMKVINLVTSSRNLNEHIDKVTMKDILTGETEEGSFFTITSVYLISLYSYDEILDLINTYL